MTATTLSFGLVADTAGKNVASKEGNLAEFIEKMDANPTTADLINMQRHMTEWSLLVDLNSTLNKTLSDTMKGVVQKSG